ncbi:hypothetical protein ACFUN7_24520 [Streptomyces sp. NPDC057236]|uniref:hypothetical protein n=1 Tax=Streptomyces sp. NPDC057236 TaxID=3346059 RepID=UPI0036271F72
MSATVCSVNPPGHDWQNGLTCRWCHATRTVTEAILSQLSSRRGGNPADARELLDAYRAGVLAEVSTWLVKKAREFRAMGGETRAAQADAVAAMASKVDRGAVRANNLRMLPADFFESGHTYTHVDDGTDWKFRVDTVTTHPEDGERTALGWRHFWGQWEACAYGEDDYEIHLLVGTADVTEETSSPAAPDNDAVARCAHLARAIQQGGRWKSGTVVRWYEANGYVGLDVHTARHDLAVLRESGAIVQHDEKGVRYFTAARDGGSRG